MPEQSDSQDEDYEHQVVNGVSFNSDNNCLALATTRGFKVFTTEPLMLKRHRDLGSPLQFVEMVDRSNFLALVGYQNTAFLGNRVALFDDNTNNIIADLTLKTNILALQIRLKKMLVALEEKVYLVDVLTLNTEMVFPTIKMNESERYNMISMSTSFTNFLLALPSYTKGYVTLVYPSREKQRRVKAHSSSLTNVVLSHCGAKVATSSQKGINIRVFCTDTGEMLQEVRRGNEYGFIYSLAFNRSGRWLACTSDSCNLHIFAIENTKRESQAPGYCNPKSKLYFLRKLFPFFDAEYSYCWYILKDFEPEMQSYVAFGLHDDSLTIVNDYGNLKKIELNLHGGPCQDLQKDQELLQIIIPTK